MKKMIVKYRKMKYVNCYWGHCDRQIQLVVNLNFRIRVTSPKQIYEKTNKILSNRCVYYKPLLEFYYGFLFDYMKIINLKKGGVKDVISRFRKENRS